MKKGICASLIVMAAFLLLPVFSVCSAETALHVSGYYEYTLTPDGMATVVTYTDYNSSSYAIDIPAELDGHAVTAVGDGENAVFGVRLTSVTIPNSVTRINSKAFYYCQNLASVALPDCLVSIGDAVFSNCYQLNAITIPESVRSIGNSAFGSCSSLTGLKLPNGVTSIGDRAFSGCEILASINLPGSLTKISDGLFYGCKELSSISLPDGIEIIGEEAFSGCASLEGIKIPASVSEIGDEAFNECERLGSANIPEQVTRIGYGVFYGCYSLRSIDLSKSVTSIGERAFLYSGLTNISIPAGVQNIGASAFSNCASLASATFPEDLIYIDKYAFYNCTELAEIILPASLTFIGERAFAGCTSLSSVKLSGSLSVDPSVFEDCPALLGYATYEGTNGAGIPVENQMWTQDALLDSLGLSEFSDFNPLNPVDHACLLAYESESREDYAPGSEKALNYRAYQVSNAKSAMVKNSDGTLFFVSDPDQASILLLMNVSYPFAGNYTGEGVYTTAYNCLVSLTAIDLASHKTIASMDERMVFGDTIRVSSDAKKIWANFPDLETGNMKEFAKKIVEFETVNGE